MREDLLPDNLSSLAQQLLNTTDEQYATLNGGRVGSTDA